jgi:ribosomal protein L6P/L9E
MFKNLRNSFALQFGYSHKVRLFFFAVRAKFLNKTTILFFGHNAKNLLFAAHELYRYRAINIFTSKGIRFTKQIIYKKIGKIGSYR